MDITNRYVLDYICRFASSHAGARILDFGCGGGQVVAAGRGDGIELYGVDVFYGGSHARREAAGAGLLGQAVLEMERNRIPFPDGFFDLITNNQVLEHVDDLDRTLAELHRVLKPRGLVLSIFPSRDVFREGHIGIPFAHWFPKDSRIRFRYTWALRCLGFGYWKQEAPSARQWAVDKLRWLDAYTRYRPRREIFSAFNKYFTSESREADYIRYRMRATPGLGPLAWTAAAPLIGPFGVAVFRKLAFLVLLSRKEPR